MGVDPKDMQGAATDVAGLSQVEPAGAVSPLRASIPSAEDEEREPALKWAWKDHWSGESGTFMICGLYVYVKDYDGDWSGWSIRKGKKGPVVAHGDCFDFHCAIFAAEDALRKIVTERIAELRAGRSASAQGGETRRAETRSGSVHEHPVAEGQAPDPTPTLKREGQS